MCVNENLASAVRQEFQDGFQDFLKGELVGLQDQVRMISGMAQPEQLCVVLRSSPIEFTPGDGQWIGYLQEDQDIRVGDFLPH